MEKDLVNIIYLELERNPDFDISSCDLIIGGEGFTDELFAFWVENNAQSKLEKETVKDHFLGKSEEVVAYLIRRLETAINPLLKARYNHLLWFLISDNRYCVEAIKHYSVVIDNLLGSNINEHRTIWKFVTIYEIILILSIDIRHELDQLEEKTLSYLHLKNLPSILKTEVITLISNKNFIKPEKTEFVPQLCIEIAESESSYTSIKNNLELSLLYLNKTPRQSYLKKRVYEMLGDNEKKKIKEIGDKSKKTMAPNSNIMVYTAMMQYYKLAKNQTKYDEASVLYNENKKHITIPMISVEVENNPSRDEILKEYCNTIFNSDSYTILHTLCFGSLPLIINECIDVCKKEYSDHEKCLEIFPAIKIDENMNIKAEDALTCRAFLSCQILKQNSFPFIISIILHIVQSKKLSYSILSKFLRKETCFGRELKAERINGKVLPYNWFGQVDFALRSFFQQCSKKDEKKRDWRITIDILSLKFEGILRDIINEKSCGRITKIDNKGNTSIMLLDDLLRNESFLTIFNEYDKLLFLYTFTSNGENIRNSVAHSFYIPQDYTIYKAILVFLCLLRLVKYEVN